ncbi:MAG: ABC transporter permease [Atribacterota bacterium]
MRYALTSQTKIIIALLLVNVVIMFSLSFLSPTFLTYGNISSLLTRMSELGVLATAVTVTFISGGFDLSIGAVMALSGMIAGYSVLSGLPLFFAISFSLLAGVLVGLMNTLFIIKLRLQPFVVTLATMTMVRSIVYGFMRGKTITAFPESLLSLGDMYVFGIPSLFIILIICAAFTALLLKRTILGRYIFALGGNERTAFLSGVPVNTIKCFVYIFSGLLSALAGLLLVIRIRAAIPDAGLNAPLEVITAVVIGGTSIKGGKGSLLGSLLGIFAMFLLINGFSLLGLNPFWSVIVLGIILIVVVGQEGIMMPLITFFLGKTRHRVD